MSSIRSVKVSLGQDIRRFAFEDYSFDLLKNTVGSLFQLQTPFVLKYQDDENDWINMSSDRELAVAFSLIQQKSLRIDVIVENSNGINLTSQQPSIPYDPTNTVVPTSLYPSMEPSIQPSIPPSSSPICVTNCSPKDFKLAMKEEKKLQKFDKKFDKLERKKEHWNEKMKRATTRLVEDVTIPDNSKISPDTQFVKIWRIRNESKIPWSSEYVFSFKRGQPMTDSFVVKLPKVVEPGDEVDISIPMRSPTIPGLYISIWKLFFQGRPFGGPFRVKIWVCEPNKISSSLSPDLEGCIGQLATMGFEDRELNQKLLKRCKNDMDKVVWKLMKKRFRQEKQQVKQERKHLKCEHRLEEKKYAY